MKYTGKKPTLRRYTPHLTKRYRPRDYTNKLIAKIVIWLMAEILLTFLGLDDLADYSEFVYERPIVMSIG